MPQGRASWVAVRCPLGAFGARPLGSQQVIRVQESFGLINPELRRHRLLTVIAGNRR
jgi:hypothetical protein